MVQCAGYKRNKSRCTATANPLSGFCWWHDPAHAEQRKRAASRGGKARTYSETADTHAVKDQLQSIADRVLGGDLESQLAYAATAALNGKLRALEILRKWREQEEIIQRIEVLEQTRLQPQGGRRSAY